MNPTRSIWSHFLGYSLESRVKLANADFAQVSLTAEVLAEAMSIIMR